MGLSIRPTLYKISQLSLYSTLQPELRYYTSSQTRTPCQHTIIIQLANIYKITSVIFSFNTELVGTSIRYKSFSMQTIYKIINYGLSTKTKKSMDYCIKHGTHISAHTIAHVMFY